MRDISYDPVIERLTCLEHTCRRWQVVGSMALALLAIVALIGVVGRRDGDEVEELRARAFVLLDRAQTQQGHYSENVASVGVGGDCTVT
jgi:hypothetical protein